MSFVLSHSFLSFVYSLFVQLDSILTAHLLLHYQVHGATWCVMHLTSIAHRNILSSRRSQILYVVSRGISADLPSRMKPSTRTYTIILLLRHRLARIAVYSTLLRVACLPYDSRPWGVLCSCSVVDVCVVSLDAWVDVACVSVAQQLVVVNNRFGVSEAIIIMMSLFWSKTALIKLF